MTRALVVSFLIVVCCVPVGAQQQAQRTILAVGAHAADMELTAGAILAHQRRLGDRVVILHLTLGEGGNPKMAPAELLGKLTAELGGRLTDPLKTTVVQDQRCMTTWVCRKLP